LVEEIITTSFPVVILAFNYGTDGTIENKDKLFLCVVTYFVSSGKCVNTNIFKIEISKLLQISVILLDN
jgi:hypothetical protein